MLVTQSCLTLGSPMGYSTPCSSVQGILQARILEWIAIPFSRGSSRPRDRTRVSRIAADSLLFEPPGKPPNIRYQLLFLSPSLSLSLIASLSATTRVNLEVLISWRKVNELRSRPVIYYIERAHISIVIIRGSH